MNTGDSEWESSFSQILSRTKQNLNRINQRYSLTVPQPLSTSNASKGEKLLPSPSYLQSLHGNANEGIPFTASLYPSEPKVSFLSDQAVPNKAAPLGSGKENLNFFTNPLINGNNMDAEQQLLERLSEKILSQLQRVQNSPGEVATSKKDFENLQSQLETLEETNQALQKEVRLLNSRLTACSGALEAFTQTQREKERDRDRDRETSRSSLSRVETWIRQEEAWREEADQKILGECLARC
jgi:regulator of replication initiation timing